MNVCGVLGQALASLLPYLLLITWPYLQGSCSFFTNNVSPPDSILHLSAGTSNSPAHVLLAPAYEGTFSVGTSLFSPVVDRSTRKEDPSGRGRERNINVRNVRGGVVEGAVSWEPSELPRGGAGEVSLRTSNSPVTLIL